MNLGDEYPKRATSFHIPWEIPLIPQRTKYLYFINWVNICLFAGKNYFHLRINIYCTFQEKQQLRAEKKKKKIMNLFSLCV